MSTTLKPQVLRSEPPSIAGLIGNVLSNRYALLQLAKREFILRYRQTLLGPVWVIAQPLLTAGILAIVFQQVIGFQQGNDDYVVLVVAGMAGWNVFNSTISRGAQSVLGNMTLLQKTRLSMPVLPLSIAPVAWVDGFLAVLTAIALHLVRGGSIGFKVFLAIPYLIMAGFVGIGMAFLFGIGAAMFRDIAFLYPTLLQLLFLLSPIAYQSATVADGRLGVLEYSPIYAPIEGIRSSILDVPGPSGRSFFASMAFGIITGLLGFALARSTDRTIVDVA
jgi:lipopolysaccharide transport system permease protein